MCKNFSLKIKAFLIVLFLPFFVPLFCMDIDEAMEGRDGLKARIEFLKSEIKRLQKVNNQANQLKEMKLQEKILVKLFDEISRMTIAKSSLEDQMAESTGDDSEFVRQITDLENREQELVLIAEQLKNRITFLSDEYSGPIDPILPTYIQRDLNFEQQHILNSSEFPECVLSQRNNIIQLKVLNQFLGQGGGAASCGYQALKNGIIIARLIYSDLPQRMQLLYELTSIGLTQSLFGKINSDWRSSVIKRLKKSRILETISNILHLTLKGSTHIAYSNIRQDNMYVLNFKKGYVSYPPFSEQDMVLGNFDNERKAFRNCIGNVARYLTDNLPIEAQQSENIVIDANEIRAAFDIALEFKGADNPNYQDASDIASRALYNNLRHNQDKIRQYFPDLDNIQIIVSNDSIVEPLTRTTTSLIDGRLPGEWLTGDEVASLIEHERNNIFLNKLADRVRMLCVGYEGQGNLSSQLKFGQDFLRDDVQEVADIIRGQFSIVCIVALLISNHWITVVINKVDTVAINKVGDEIQYILADSVGTSRINDPRVHELIALLEGHENRPIENKQDGCNIL